MFSIHSVMLNLPLPPRVPKSQFKQGEKGSVPNMDTHACVLLFELTEQLQSKGTTEDPGQHASVNCLFACLQSSPVTATNSKPNNTKL